MDYQKLYHKLFNALTDLAVEMHQLAGEMESLQQECEAKVIECDTLPENGEKS